MKGSELQLRIGELRIEESLSDLFNPQSAIRNFEEVA
jgi:hypothetical protein